MADALVSVVVAFFNQENFICETLESICRQTHRRLQIIAVDDGSRDDGARLVEREFGARVELIRQANLGPSAAVNAALLRVRGDYIALLGGDDLCMPERFEQQLQQLDEGALDIVFCRPDIIDKSGRPLPQSDYPVFYRKLEPAQSIFGSLLFDDNFLCAPSAMLRAEIIRAVGPFHDGLIQLQDYDYWLRAAGLGYRLGVFDTPLVAYRRHPGNLSGQSRDFATLTELPFVVERAVYAALPAILRQEFPELLSIRTRQDSPLTALDRVSLLLAHPRAEVRAAGMSRLMTLMEDADFRSFADRNGLNPFQLLFNVGTSIAERKDPLKLALRH